MTPVTSLDTADDALMMDLLGDDTVAFDTVRGPIARGGPMTARSGIHTKQREISFDHAHERRERAGPARGQSAVVRPLSAARTSVGISA
jgi:hypothetical protein